MIALWRGFCDLLLPRRCAACTAALPGSTDDALCTACADELPWLADGRCRLCQETPVATAHEICSACASTPSPLRACIASAAYDGEALHWIQRFKYPGKGIAGLDPRPEAVVRAMARLAARRVPGPAPDLVVPIPLHPARLRQRGFNPAATLAREVAREARSRSAATALRRIRDTPSQTGLDRIERRRNAAGAFQSTRPLPPRVWIVDDVVTTGSTLAEAARTLRRAGAREVSAVCAARTPSPR